MSDHKIPLTELEKKGLEAHGLRIGVPSQLSDAFRHGMKWAQAARDAEVAELRTKLEEAERKVYVPGLWRCAKCKLDLIATALSNQGHFANNNPQACPNGCGPMWRVTERDQRQEAQRLFEREFDARKEAERKLGDLLARIHRDGGHYTGQHGMEKSVEDAHTIVATLFADKRKLEEAGNMLPADLWNKAIGLGERRGMERAAVICEKRASSVQYEMVGACNQCARDIRAAADTKERTDG